MPGQKEEKNGLIRRVYKQNIYRQKAYRQKKFPTELNAAGNYLGYRTRCWNDNYMLELRLRRRRSRVIVLIVTRQLSVQFLLIQLAAVFCYHDGRNTVTNQVGQRTGF